jgi:AraC-like DNA-binding protein
VQTGKLVMSKSERKAVIYTSQQRSLYVGRTERILKRVNVSSTLLVSLEDDLELLDRSEHKLHRSKSFLIPAGMEVAIDTRHSKVAMCFLNDIGTDLPTLIPKMKESICFSRHDCLYSGLNIEQDIINHKDFLCAPQTSSDDALGQLSSWIESSNLSITDDRITKAIEYIKLHYSNNISVEAVANHVNLSVPRLVQLFKQVTGSPIRRFRQWHRIFTTAQKISMGFSLTDAAIDSGFSDYAQFSRTYRQFAGGSPSAARNNTDIKVLAQCA